MATKRYSAQMCAPTENRHKEIKLKTVHSKERLFGFESQHIINGNKSYFQSESRKNFENKIMLVVRC